MLRPILGGRAGTIFTPILVESADRCWTRPWRCADQSRFSIVVQVLLKQVQLSLSLDIHRPNAIPW